MFSQSLSLVFRHSTFNIRPHFQGQFRRFFFKFVSHLTTPLLRPLTLLLIDCHLLHANTISYKLLRTGKRNNKYNTVYSINIRRHNVTAVSVTYVIYVKERSTCFYVLNNGSQTTMLHPIKGQLFLSILMNENCYLCHLLD